MVTITFQAKSEEASKLFSMLKAYGVDNLTKKEEDKIKVSPEEIRSINTGIEQANKGMLTESSKVHAKAKDLCTK